MKKRRLFMTLVCIMLVAAMLPVAPVAKAVELATMEGELTLGGESTAIVGNWNRLGIVSTVNQYFAQREAFLIGQASDIDVAVHPMVDDEEKHITAMENKGFTVVSSSAIINEIDYWDSHAEVTATETMAYLVDGSEAQVSIQHELIVYPGEDGTAGVVSDSYYNSVANFRSCSYVSEADIATAASAVGGKVCIANVALGEVGYQEYGPNETKYGAWYGTNGVAWCVMFVIWCARQVSIPASVIPKTASTNYLKDWLSDRSRYYASAAQGGSPNPAIGDVVFFTNDEGNGTGHVGVITSTSTANGTITVVEGNNGDQVTKKTYSKTSSALYGFGRPAYSGYHAESDWYTDYTYHWMMCPYCDAKHSAARHDFVKISVSGIYECTECGFRTEDL